MKRSLKYESVTNRNHTVCIKGTEDLKYQNKIRKWVKNIYLRHLTGK